MLDIWHVAIPVSDLGKSVEFYSGLLGLKVIGFDEYSSKKQAFVATKPGGFTIELFEAKGPRKEEAPKRPDHLAFECADLKALRERLVARSKDIPEIETFDNGIHHIGLEDPDGVTIDLFQGRAIFEEEIKASRP
jgi:catechol 2,3-dioxygenase-like lactoylglutathione lyase family enzyme